MLRRPFKPLHHGGSPEAAVELLSLAMEGWQAVARGNGLEIHEPGFHAPADAAE
jgi:hypothetical protein